MEREKISEKEYYDLPIFDIKNPKAGEFRTNGIEYNPYLISTLVVEVENDQINSKMKLYGLSSEEINQKVNDKEKIELVKKLVLQSLETIKGI